MNAFIETGGVCIPDKAGDQPEQTPGIIILDPRERLVAVVTSAQAVENGKPFLPTLDFLSKFSPVELGDHISFSQIREGSERKSVTVGWYGRKRPDGNVFSVGYVLDHSGDTDTPGVDMMELSRLIVERDSLTQTMSELYFGNVPCTDTGESVLVSSGKNVGHHVKDLLLLSQSLKLTFQIKSMLSDIISREVHGSSRQLAVEPRGENNTLLLKANPQMGADLLAIA